MHSNIPSTQHSLTSDQIDLDALNVISRLSSAGYEAYLVGGSVRDLLAGLHPKDFDISTSALPEEVKRIFGRQCILIGRRFRLAHIRFGKKVIEVATFRSGDSTQDELIVHDNRWGSAEEDALRRDFTINGLFYEPLHNVIVDYVGGREDVEKRLIRSIGDPNLRYRQDPVRMLRALKFRARLGFAIAPQDEEAIHRNYRELSKSSQARLLEELLKMLESGSSSPFFKLMAEYSFLKLIMPCLSSFLEKPQGQLIYQYLGAADELQKTQKRPLDRGLLIAALLYPILEQEINFQSSRSGEPLGFGEIVNTIGTMIEAVILSEFPHFPKRLIAIATHSLMTQYRITPLNPKRHCPDRLLQQREFFLSLQLLQIRTMVHPELQPFYERFEQRFLKIQHASEPRYHHTPHKGPEEDHKEPEEELELEE